MIEGNIRSNNEHKFIKQALKQPCLLLGLRYMKLSELAAVR